MGTRRRVGMSYSCRVLSGFACAVALVLGLLSLLDPPAQAATGAGTWSLDAAPGQLGFGEVDAISCADPTYCVALSSNQYEDDALIDSNGSWSTRAPRRTGRRPAAQQRVLFFRVVLYGCR